MTSYINILPFVRKWEGGEVYFPEEKQEIEIGDTTFKIEKITRHQISTVSFKSTPEIRQKIERLQGAWESIRYQSPGKALQGG